MNLHTTAFRGKMNVLANGLTGDFLFPEAVGTTSYVVVKEPLLRRGTPQPFASTDGAQKWLFALFGERDMFIKVLSIIMTPFISRMIHRCRLALIKTKICTSCKRKLPATTQYFYYSSSKKDKLGSQCKRCRKAGTNPLNERARILRGRAKRYGATEDFTGEDLALIGNRQGWRCWYCQKECRDNYEIDHRIPLSRGGSNAPDNIVISCPTCNKEKNNKLPHEFNGRLL